MIRSATRRARKPSPRPDPERLARLQKRLRVAFRRPRLLGQALVHRSYRADDEAAPTNERLEFLGDAVLGQIVAEHLYRAFPDWSEGDLTKLKAAAVSEATLSDAARRLGLGEFLIMARGEELSGGRDRPSMLSDALEAVIGAVYLDRGLRATREFVLRALAAPMRALERDERRRDYKTMLQELIQMRHQQLPAYRVVAEQGPDHDKTFVVQARFAGQLLGAGSGKSKKEAEQSAAKDALDDVKRLERIIKSAA